MTVRTAAPTALTGTSVLKVAGADDEREILLVTSFTDDRPVVGDANGVKETFARVRAKKE